MMHCKYTAKGPWILLLVGTLSLVKSHHIYAVGSLKNSSMTYPIQPMLAEECDLLSFISPFEMTALSLGVSYPNYNRERETAFMHAHWFKRKLPSILEVKLETPLYREKEATGLDCSFYYTPPDQLSQLTTPSRDASYFAVSIGADVLATYKKKYPINISIGHFAGTITGKTGFITAVGDTPATTGFGLGWVGGVGVGCDYYFSQWMGCFFEFSCKYNRVLLSKGNMPDSFYTSALTFGLKTTF